MAVLAEAARRGEPGEAIVVVGPPSAVHDAQSLGVAVDATIAAPAGIHSLASRRLRALIAGRGLSPLTTVTWGSWLAPMVRRAIPSAQRIVYDSAPVGSDAHCADAARAFWRGSLDSERNRVRRELGISPDAFVVLVGGDSAAGIDAFDAFLIVCRAARAGCDVVAISPARAKRAAEARSHARASGVERRLATVEGAELPSRLWRGCDLMLLKRPSVDRLAPWWGACAFWATEAGIPVLAEECAPAIDSVEFFAQGGIDAAARAIVRHAERAAATTRSR